MNAADTLHPLQLDNETCVIFLEVPGKSVVLLQGYLDLYEGLATVRTLNIQDSLVCIITTPDMYNHCVEVLHSITDTVPWRSVEHPSPEDQQLLLGYFNLGSKGENKKC